MKVPARTHERAFVPAQCERRCGCTVGDAPIHNINDVWKLVISGIEQNSISSKWRWKTQLSSAIAKMMIEDDSPKMPPLKTARLLLKLQMRFCNSYATPLMQRN